MSLTLPAYAKINLTLQVLRKRADGYHEIASVLQSISLSDTLTVSPASDLSLSAPGLDCPVEDNLALKAARLLQETTGCTLGADIRLQKRIPSAAGLGGGSSDAATTLLALNELWGLGLERASLLILAAGLGSDVPFFLYGGTVLAQGRGERLTPLPSFGGLWVVLASPPLAIPHKTRSLYAALSPNDFADGQATWQMVADLRAGRGLDHSLLVNAFERAAFALYPSIAHCRQALLVAGAPFVRLSGSGPTVYTLVKEETEGRALCQSLAGRGIACHLARFQENA